MKTVLNKLDSSSLKIDFIIHLHEMLIEKLTKRLY